MKELFKQIAENPTYLTLAIILAVCIVAIFALLIAVGVVASKSDKSSKKATTEEKTEEIATEQVEEEKVEEQPAKTKKSTKSKKETKTAKTEETVVTETEATEQSESSADEEAKAESADKAKTQKYMVTYDKESKLWVVKKTGAQRASKKFETKAQAFKFAERISGEKGMSLTVKKKNGQFQKAANAKKSANNNSTKE